MLQKDTSARRHHPPSSSWASITEIWWICGCCILETSWETRAGARASWLWGDLGWYISS